MLTGLKNQAAVIMRVYIVLVILAPGARIIFKDDNAFRAVEGVVVWRGRLPLSWLVYVQAWFPLER